MMCVCVFVWRGNGDSIMKINWIFFPMANLMKNVLFLRDKSANQQPPDVIFRFVDLFLISQTVIESH